MAQPKLTHAQQLLLTRLLKDKELHMAGCHVRYPTARVLVKLGLAIFDKGYLVLK